MSQSASPRHAVEHGGQDAAAVASSTRARARGRSAASGRPASRSSSSRCQPRTPAKRQGEHGEDGELLREAQHREQRHRPPQRLVQRVVAAEGEEARRPRKASAQAARRGMRPAEQSRHAQHGQQQPGIERLDVGIVAVVEAASRRRAPRRSRAGSPKKRGKTISASRAGGIDQSVAVRRAESVLARRVGEPPQGGQELHGGERHGEEHRHRDPRRRRRAAGPPPRRPGPAAPRPLITTVDGSPLRSWSASAPPASSAGRRQPARPRPARSACPPKRAPRGTRPCCRTG